MAWIEAEAVAVLLQTELDDDVYVPALIDHAQSLAEIEIGEQAAPSARLRAVLAQIVARMWQAGRNAQLNPAALTQDVAGPFSFQAGQVAGAAGLGLTNREKSLLRKAVGRGDLWVQPTYRGASTELGPIGDDELRDETDDLELLVSAQGEMIAPPED